MAFDASFALNVVLPLAEAAYSVMSTEAPSLPSGFEQTALVRADVAKAATTDHAAGLVTAMTKDTSIFGLMGRNTETATAFIAFRGTQDLEDWVHDLDAIDTDYAPIADFGHVHAGFQAVYELVRDSISANIAATCSGCTQIVITGHSLGAAVALLAAPDVFRTMPPRLEPRVITFAGPRVGLPDFAGSFNTDIEACFRVVNFLDIVPHVPVAPYVHVGAAVDIDSGGDLSTRHDLASYRAGLSALAAVGSSA